jgi:hypothetical protein
MLEAKVVGRDLARLHVILDVSDDEPLLHVSVAGIELCKRLIPGRAFTLEVEDATVVACRVLPPR